MAFWKKRTPPPAPRPAASGSSDRPKTEFLSGDALTDRRSVQVLLDTIARVTESRDLESLLDYVVDSSIDVTGAEHGLLVLLNDSGEQVVRVARQRGQAVMEGQPKYSTSVVKRVLDEDAPMRTMVQSDAEALELGTSVFDLKLRAVMCVPLTPQDGEKVTADAQRGALYVDSKAATREFKDQDLALFAALAQHIAIALENARLNIESLEKVRLEKTLEIASEIQSGLMPQAPKALPGYDIFGWYRPAEHAAGDFYDFIKMKDDRFAVVVGDVSGHGIGPALITATAQAGLRSYARMLAEPGPIVTMLNQDLAEKMDDGMFLTLFVAMLSAAGGAQVLNAGHTPPLVWRKETGKVESIPGDGPALGMVDDFEYAEGPGVRLAEGDIMIAFTDGLVEARHMSRPDRLFDESGLRAVISDVAPRASARELAEEIVRNVLDFCGGEREDDMTIVVVRRVAH